MKILLLGYSSLARRRVIPALESMPQVKSVDVACRRSGVEIAGKKIGKCFQDYDTALRESKATWVYVSTVNSEHVAWVEKALASGRHVMVDKPAFLTQQDADRCVEAALKAGLCLSEATVYAHHPQVALVRELFSKAGDEPLRISAQFTFPPLEEGNFRHQEHLGGGAILDLGPYAVAAGFDFFSNHATTWHTLVTGWRGRVETSFSVLAGYANGKCLVGHFGFDVDYRNTLSLVGKKLVVDVERIFTMPVDAKGIVSVRENGVTRRLESETGDAFANYMTHVIAAVENGDTTSHSNKIPQNMAALLAMRRTAGLK